MVSGAIAGAGRDVSALDSQALSVSFGRDFELRVVEGVADDSDTTLLDVDSFGCRCMTSKPSFRVVVRLTLISGGDTGEDINEAERSGLPVSELTNLALGTGAVSGSRFING